MADGGDSETNIIKHENSSENGQLSHHSSSSQYGSMGPGPIHQQHPHHVSEFGELENLVHIEEPEEEDHDELPAPHISRKDKLARAERLKRLRKKLFKERHIHQYFQGTTLYRSAATRTIGSDELFLDLIIVGGIAALGHELRESFQGWFQVETFLLLFVSLMNSWRQIVLLWNMWGLASDLTDKFGIYTVFTCLCFIALGSEAAFTDYVRIYVGVASFLAVFIPAFSSAYWGKHEPLLKQQTGGCMNQLSFYLVVSTVSNIPYLIAALSRSEQFCRSMYWLGAFCNTVGVLLTFRLYDWFFKDYPRRFRVAVNIEVFVEKYEVLTMIVLGESILGILFEAADIVDEPGVRLASIFGTTAMACGMLYSLQTLYINVDSPVFKGGKHAIRHRSFNGALWSILHVPYHAGLVLLATGLGLSIRDIGLPDKNSFFDVKARILFSIGLTSCLISGLLGQLHFPGPRAATKLWRFVARCLFVLPFVIFMPFVNISADWYILIHGVLLIIITLIEYSLVQMDKLGFFASEATHFFSNSDSVAMEKLVFDEDDFVDDDSNEDTDENDSEKDISAKIISARIAQEASQIEIDEDHVEAEEARRRLRERLCSSHRNRLIAECKKKTLDHKDTPIM